MKFQNFNLEQWIRNWLTEDVGSGDLTTDHIVPDGATAKAYIYAKQPGVLAGVDIAAQVFKLLNPQMHFVPRKQDGDRLEASAVIAEVEGDARALLTGERLALNLLQRLSGIATQTDRMATLVSKYPVRLVDTRKTTPGLRLLEKYAVTVGGGYNHRLGLFDAVLIKDNHIKVAGNIRAAVETVRQRVSHTVKIEVEVESMEGVEEALAAKADIIMLDNMDNDQMTEAVRSIGGRAVVEASGGINDRTIIGVAATGIDVISVGALTHSVAALDISMDIGAIK